MAQGIALYHSLIKHASPFTLWVLALDDKAEAALRNAGFEDIEIVSIAQLEAFDNELQATRGTRSLVEYYFTCSPCFPRYLLKQHQAIEAITYLDSDLYFFSSPEAIFEELRGGSIAIIPHRFSPKSTRSHARFGAYNVGWVTFVRDEPGEACLEWWRARCIEWCYDRVDGDRYADQKYLDRFNSLFDSVRVIANPGANLAPWNVATHTITTTATTLDVDGSPLLFFHFQGLRKLVNGFYDSNLGGYGARLTPALRQRVFRPYLRALQDAEAFVATILPASSLGKPIRQRAHGFLGMRYTVGRIYRAIKAVMMRTVVQR